MLSKSNGEEDDDSDGSKSTTTTSDDTKKKAGFYVDGASLHYTREMGNTMCCNFSGKAHHVSVWEEAVHFLKNGPSYGDVLYHVNY